jgi:hypothetical protein
VADKKLQQAITREEKTREAVEKEARKAAERTSAREEFAREKVARQAEKKVKKTQKTREAELRKIEIEKRRIERKKSSSQKAKVGEKRSIDDDEVDRSRKRVRFVRSHLRNQPLAIKSISQLDFAVIEHSNDTNGDTITATDELQLQDANRWSNSLPLRSGRYIRPPARF